jgi:hypothetical protein
MTPDSQPSSLSPNNERSIMDHDLDSRLFDEVLEASSDTHADSLRALRSDLAERKIKIQIKEMKSKDN